MTTILQALLDELRNDPDAQAQLRELVTTSDPYADRDLTPREAALRLGVHQRTLLDAAREGRVPGAHRQGVKLWRFTASQLEILPRPIQHIGDAGPGRPRRPLQPSAAVRAIRDSGKRAAA